MKKSMKKHLILALVVMAMVLTTVFAVSAATSTEKYYCPECKTDVTVNIYEIVAPTCEAEGYSKLECNGVNEDGTPCGYKFKEIKADKRPATGHKLSSDITYVKPSSDSNYYEGRAYCKNEGCELYTTKGGTTNPIKYHKVTFVNLCTTKDVIDKGYTKLADKYYSFDNAEESQNCILAVKYIEEGKSVENIGAKRDADLVYGAYELVGWTTDKAEAMPETADIEKNYSGYTTNVAIAADDTIADRIVYAVFKPLDVTYTIAFYDDNGKLISGNLPSIKAKHGKPIQLSASYKHEKADDMTFRYDFSHWAVQSYSDIKIENGTPIYGKMNLKAVFNPVAKKYLLAYYLSDGETPVMYNGVAAVDEVCPGDGIGATKGLAMNTTYVEGLYSYSTREYDYKFTGKWIVANGQAAGIELDLNNLDLSNMLDTVASNNQPIILVPKYQAIERLYPIDIVVGYIDDIDETQHPTKATLQITDASGNLVLTKTLTRNPEDAYYKYTAKVPYTDKYYRVSVVSDAYAGSAESSYSETRGRFSNVVFDMERKGKDDCNCFCHSLIKPIWIKVLNVVYSLFGKKIVCCDDLFAENGHLLNYTAND